MPKYLKSLLFLLMVTVSFGLYAERVVIIKSISSNKHRFVIHWGKLHGIIKGQESLFSSETYSIAAKAIEVSQNLSLWEPVNPYVTVPFNIEEFVVFNNSIDNIYSEIPILRTILKQKLYVTKQSWTFRFGITQAISESVSTTETHNESVRNGYNLEGLVNKEINRKFSYGLGIRIDKENTVLDEPALEIPTTRMMIIGEIAYAFDKFKGSKNNLFATIGTGYGTSQSTINENVSKGTSLMFPAIRLGIQNNQFKTLSYLFEIVGESIHSTELFTDGEKQSYNIMNAKLSVGVKF